MVSLSRIFMKLIYLGHIFHRASSIDCSEQDTNQKVHPLHQAAARSVFFFALILWMHNEFKSRIQFGNWFEKKTRPGLYFALSLSFSISIMYGSFRKINFRYLKVIKMWQWTYYQVEMIKELKILNYAWNCYGITFWFRFYFISAFIS